MACLWAKWIDGGLGLSSAHVRRQEARALHLPGGIDPAPVDAKVLQERRDNVQDRDSLGVNAVLAALDPEHAVRMMHAALGVRERVEDVAKPGVEPFYPCLGVYGLVEVAAKEQRVRGRRGEIEDRDPVDAKPLQPLAREVNLGLVDKPRRVLLGHYRQHGLG